MVWRHVELSKTQKRTELARSGWDGVALASEVTGWSSADNISRWSDWGGGEPVDLKHPISKASCMWQVSLFTWSMDYQIHFKSVQKLSVYLLQRRTANSCCILELISKWLVYLIFLNLAFIVSLPIQNQVETQNKDHFPKPMLFIHSLALQSHSLKFYLS